MIIPMHKLAFIFQMDFRMFSLAKKVTRMRFPEPLPWCASNTSHQEAGSSWNSHTRWKQGPQIWKDFHPTEAGGLVGGCAHPDYLRQTAKLSNAYGDSAIN